MLCRLFQGSVGLRAGSPQEGLTYVRSEQSGVNQEGSEEFPTYFIVSSDPDSMAGQDASRRCKLLSHSFGILGNLQKLSGVLLRVK